MFLCRQCPKGNIIYTRIVEPMHYLKNRIKISWNQWNVEHHCLRTLPGSFGIYLKLLSCEAMLSSGTVAENSPASARGPGLIPGWGDPPEKGTAAHSSVLAWRTPWIEEPGGPQCMGSQRGGHMWVTCVSISPSLLFSSCVILGTCLNLSEPPFPCQ